MEYLDLIRKFWKMNKVVCLNASTIQLYFYLLEYCYRNNKNNFKLSDVEIFENLKMSRKTIKSNKEILKQLGLIKYQTINGLPTSYEIIVNYTLNGEKTSISSSELTKKSITDISYSQKEVTTENISYSASKVKSNINQNIPTLQEFMDYAKTLEVYDEQLDFAIKSRYESWKENNWRNGYNTPIKNWKQSLKNVFPFLGKTPKVYKKIPSIVRPKQTYDE